MKEIRNRPLRTVPRRTLARSIVVVVGVALLSGGSPAGAEQAATPSVASLASAGVGPEDVRFAGREGASFCVPFRRGTDEGLCVIAALRRTGPAEEHVLLKAHRVSCYERRGWECNIRWTRQRCIGRDDLTVDPVLETAQLTTKLRGKRLVVTWQGRGEPENGTSNDGTVYQSRSATVDGRWGRKNIRSFRNTYAHAYMFRRVG